MEAVGCPRCHRPVPTDAPFGECPACLLLLGLADTPDGGREGTVAVTVAAAAARASGTAPADPDATLTRGSEGAAGATDWPDIPGYRIVDELGAGGAGTVYLARQLAADGRLVAVKVLHGTSRQERERMAREARSLGRLAHPNVVCLHDVDEATCGPFFTMEYVSGGSLARRIQVERPAVAESARIVAQVARAVQAAHDLGIRHRDLKPSNILLEPDGTAKVADFGLAKLDPGPGETPADRLTLTGHLLGTPAYMAPEQAGKWHSAVSDRTDVYGLGAVLYQCLTGRPPAAGATREETLRKVLLEEVALPRSVVPDVPPVLEAVCLKCLEKDALRRYRTAGEVADELDRWMRGEPTRVRPLGPVRRAWRATRPVAGRLSAVAALLLIVMIAVAVGRYYGQEPDPKALEAAELQRLNREIDGGDEVDLIPQGGVPRYSRWITGAVPISPSKGNDGVFSFVALDWSRLELLPPDLGPPAFELTAVLRHDGNEADNSMVGLYFGYREELQGPDLVRRGFNVLFHDYPPEPGSLLGTGTNGVFVYPFRYKVLSNRWDEFGLAAVMKSPLVSAEKNQPRTVRRFRIRASAEGLMAWLVGDDGIEKPFVAKPFTPAQIRGRLLKTNVDPRAGDATVEDSKSWAAGGVGVLAIRGQLSVGRLTIRKLSDS